MGIFDKIKAKLSDPEVQQKAKDAVAKAQQKRGGGTPGGVAPGAPGGRMPQSGWTASQRGPGGYDGPGGYYPYDNQDSDGDGIPDNQDNQPYGGPEDYTGMDNPVEQTPYDNPDTQGDVEYVDEDGNPVDSSDVQAGDYQEQDSGGDFDSGSGYDSGDSYDSGSSFDSGSSYDSGSSDSGSSDSGW